MYLKQYYPKIWRTYKNESKQTQSEKNLITTIVKIKLDQLQHNSKGYKLVTNTGNYCPASQE